MHINGASCGCEDGDNDEGSLLLHANNGKIIDELSVFQEDEGKFLSPFSGIFTQKFLLLLLPSLFCN